MRLAASTLIAAALHGVLFGAAAVVLSRPAAVPAAPVPVEVEVVAPRPDPVADSAPSAASAATPPPAPRSRPKRRERQAEPRHELALARDPSLVDPTAEPAAPSVPDPPPVAVGPSSPAPAAPARADAGRQAAGASAGAVVSAKPRYRSNPTPEYPIPCKRRREEGIVYLNVVVEPGGLPATVSLNRSSGHPLLDRAALEAVRHWTFEPARAAGVPVSSMVVIPIRFFLSEQP
ncbi:MAG TPA: energy transducer TonB [Polyangia bacterium]|nr:energy transducer TonB [Polyangia bacterium]